MIGVDANVLVRFLVEDDEAQSAAAAAFLLDEGNVRAGFFVSRIVLAELEWVLSSGYGFDRTRIHGTLSDLARTLSLIFEDREEFERALEAYRVGRADLSDCLIVENAWTASCDGFVTFDKALAAGGDARVRRLKARV